MAQKLYIFTNESMPDLVKIGHTKGSIERRLKELDSTGIPTPFECFYAAEVKDSQFVESKLHKIFSDKRKRYNREFFKANPYQVRAAIQLAEITDITPKEKIINEQVSVKLRSEKNTPKVKNGRENLRQFDLPSGATLTLPFAKILL
jgi:hypothetical protein